MVGSEEYLKDSAALVDLSQVGTALVVENVENAKLRALVFRSKGELVGIGGLAVRIN